MGSASIPQLVQNVALVAAAGAALAIGETVTLLTTLFLHRY